MRHVQWPLERVLRSPDSKNLPVAVLHCLRLLLAEFEEALRRDLAIRSGLVLAIVVSLDAQPISEGLETAPESAVDHLVCDDLDVVDVGEEEGELCHEFCLALGEICAGDVAEEVGEVVVGVEAVPVHVGVHDEAGTDAVLGEELLVDSLKRELLELDAAAVEEVDRVLVVVLLLPKRGLMRERFYLRSYLKLNCQVQWGEGYSPFSLLRVMPSWINFKLFTFLRTRSYWQGISSTPVYLTREFSTREVIAWKLSVLLKYKLNKPTMAMKLYFSIKSLIFSISWKKLPM